MWAAFIHELVLRDVPNSFAGCVRLHEASASHELFTAALHSHHSGSVGVPRIDTNRAAAAS
jgi:hypothetical protein